MLESQIETPALVLDMDVFEENRRTVMDFLESRNLKLRPHYKSHKCTAIAHLQMQDGAKGICCAKVSEAEDLIASGIDDVLIANQITDLPKVSRVAALAGCCHLTVCVDQAQNINDLSAAACLQGTVIHCLVEYDIGMIRCGVRSFDEVYALVKQIAAAPNLSFEGIQAYAGQLSHHMDDNTRRVRSLEIEAELGKLKGFLEERGIPVKEVSGVSTGTVFNRPQCSVYTEIQAGSYIFMDACYGAMKLGLGNALFVLSSVISLSGGLIITDAGRKSVGVDQGKPFFTAFPEKEIDFSEEHSSVVREGTQSAIGDRLRMVPGHCCTTANLHDCIYFVRNGKVVDRVPVTSRGKSR